MEAVAKYAVKSKLFRKTSSGALNASAHVPNSGITALDNSQGASRTVAELSATLDESLQDIDTKSDLADLLDPELLRLQTEVQKYSNGQVEDFPYGTDWICSPHDAQAIYVAANCASSAYDADYMALNEHGVSIERLHYITPSILGTIKGTSFSVAAESVGGSKPAGNLHLPALIVAIKGTASVVDGMVNANGESQEARGFFRVSNPEQVISDDGKTSDIRVHGGFMNGARALSKHTTPLIKKYLEASGARHVIFTGHSAGGATAALLFVQFLSDAAVEYPDVQVSSITFGAPPVTNPDLTSFLKDAHPNAEHCRLLLAIANEKDVVSRVDNNYVRSLLTIYRISRNDPPLGEGKASDLVAPAVGKGKEPVQPPAGDMEPDGKLETPEGSNRMWEMPKPNYFNLGRIIVCRNANPVGDFELRPVSVEPKEFHKLLFCDIGVHSRLLYVQNVEDLLGLAGGNGDL